MDKKANNKNWDKKGFALAMLVLCVLGYGLFRGFSKVMDLQTCNMQAAIRQDADSTYCSIKSLGYAGRGYFCYYQYTVDGFVYKGNASCNLDVQLGERYKIIYKRSNPLAHFILFQYPLLPDGQPVATNCSEVVQADEYDVRVQYEAGGKQYKRFQRIKDLDLAYKVGEHYTFNYLPGKPQSGYVERKPCR